MQMGYDFNAALQAGESKAGAAVPGNRSRAGDGARAGSLLPESFPPESAPLRHPDWASLRAHFLAMHALRRAVASVPVTTLPGGGFAGAGGSVLSACRDNPAVNPVYWANLKEESVITDPVAASPTRGDRGLA